MSDKIRHGDLREIVEVLDNIDPLHYTNFYSLEKHDLERPLTFLERRFLSVADMIVRGYHPCVKRAIDLCMHQQARGQDPSNLDEVRLTFVPDRYLRLAGFMLTSDFLAVDSVREAILNQFRKTVEDWISGEYKIQTWEGADV